MHIGYLNDRKELGYLALRDETCSIKLVFISNSVESKSQIIIAVICFGILVFFGNVEPVEAKDIVPGVEGFQAPIVRQNPRSRGFYETKPASGQSPASGNNGGNPNPNSGSDNGSCSSSLTPKPAPEVAIHGSESTYKTKKQKALEKMLRELEESIKEENKINAQRKKQGKPPIILTIRDGIRFFEPMEQLRDKYHHAPAVKSPIPESLGEMELARLSDPKLYRERLETFRNKEILPDAFVEQYGQDIRFHVLNPDTKIIEGTLGANSEKIFGRPKEHGYHLYNDITGVNVFFTKNGRIYRTGFKTNISQQNDLKTNGNMM